MAIEQQYTRQELVYLLKQKDSTAFGYLYDKYAAAFYGIIFKNLNKDEVSAQDILQDVFLKIWKNVDGYDNTREGLFVWMIRILSATIKDKTGVIKHYTSQMRHKNVNGLYQ